MGIKCGNADGHWVCGDLAVTDLSSTDDKLGTNCDRYGTKRRGRVGRGGVGRGGDWIIEQIFDVETRIL